MDCWTWVLSSKCVINSILENVSTYIKRSNNPEDKKYNNAKNFKGIADMLNK